MRQPVDNVGFEIWRLQKFQVEGRGVIVKLSKDETLQKMVLSERRTKSDLLLVHARMLLGGRLGDVNLFFFNET